MFRRKWHFTRRAGVRKWAPVNMSLVMVRTSARTWTTEIQYVEEQEDTELCVCHLPGAERGV